MENGESRMVIEKFQDSSFKLQGVNRRTFLKQNSLGAAGLALTVVHLPALAAGNPASNRVLSAALEGTDFGKGDFEPVRYRPIAAKVIGLKRRIVSLDGAWRIDAKPGQDIRERPLSNPTWGDFHVPGQWAQQGYEIPESQSVALAREVAVPHSWAGYRIFLRFDAIHGATHYWLNGKLLGYSENLFTPVEWEITDAVIPGQTNRLDLQMKVASVSEKLSSSSGYAGYSLGGIDRAVRIYALPTLHLSSLHLSARLDKAYQNGELQIQVGLDNPDQNAEAGFELEARLFDAHERAVDHSTPIVSLDPIEAGRSTVSIQSRVANPLKWNAEQPNLYKLALILKKNGKALEQIERNIGFRTVETKERQLYVNGARVKLAGVCHHEIDPVTGRANTMRHAEDDVKRFKSANLNHVRTSHYPCTQEFLDAADRYGLYVESESPFCWVAPANDLGALKEILTPVSAMVDYNHSHPCVILWSLGNESHWSELFEHSDRWCKQLDPTRPTVIEHTFSNENKVTCSIVSRHYQDMPYDNVLKNDLRPFLHGECFFLIYHERTGVAINPGLRELWAAGSADPDSEWGKYCLESFAQRGVLNPGIYPGAWSYIYSSNHCIGSEIWSGVDDIAFLPGAKIVSSERGNAYWGLLDGWRRPKPELELAKFVFSPVWFPVRQLDYEPGQTRVRVPVENRYSFTDLNQLDFTWEVNGEKGNARVDVAPASKGEIEISLPTGTSPGATLLIRGIKGDDEVVNATLALGQREPISLTEPQAGAPRWSDDGRFIAIEGRNFYLVFNRASGDFDAANPKHRAPIKTFPSLHVTRHDFGDLQPKKPPYTEFPDAATRVIERVTAADTGNGLELIVADRYECFFGTIRWLIDKDGAGRISYDYAYTGDDLDSREIGIKATLHHEYDRVKWRRWSEWGIFPEDSICRTEGEATARRDKKWPDQPVNLKPAWPWSQDQTPLGTADFRSIKFCIYEASLAASNGSGVCVKASADAHFRACLAEDGVRMHILSQCPLAPVVLKNGARLTGSFSFAINDLRFGTSEKVL